jgi:hypothetical protein
METTININDLAKKFDKVAQDICPYEYADADYSWKCAKSDLLDRPFETIDNLLNIISDLLDRIN